VLPLDLQSYTRRNTRNIFSGLHRSSLIWFTTFLSTFCTYVYRLPLPELIDNLAVLLPQRSLTASYSYI
jgi:hypothetical protein